MNSLLFGIIGVGLVAVGASAPPAPFSAAATLELAMTSPELAAGAAPVAIITPPADLENDDSGDYMKGMSPAQLEKLYAQHDAEVARLMAEAPDEHMFGDVSLIDPETGEQISIDVIAF